MSDRLGWTRVPIDVQHLASWQVTGGKDGGSMVSAMISATGPPPASGNDDDAEAVTVFMEGLPVLVLTPPDSVNEGAIWLGEAASFGDVQVDSMIRCAGARFMLSAGFITAEAYALWENDNEPYTAERFRDLAELASDGDRFQAFFEEICAVACWGDHA